MKINPWYVLALALFFGALSIALGNGFFPYLKERREVATKKQEESDRQKANLNTIRNIVADEAVRNIRTTIRMLKHLEKGNVIISPLMTTGLDIVISSRITDSLDPSFFKSLLNTAYVIKQSQNIHNRITLTMLSSTTQAANQMEGLKKEWGPYLKASLDELAKFFFHYNLGAYLTYKDDAAEIKRELLQHGVMAQF